jgi:hypothetical protein
MASESLRLPFLLQKRLAEGRWPSTAREAMSQYLRSLIAIERVRLFAPEENKIHLQAPPILTVDEELNQASGARQFWLDFGALDEISTPRSLIIGDFGLGSDAPIIMDYREPNNPPVLRLKWSEAGLGKVRTSWVKGANSFDEFAEMLGLTSRA